MSRYVKSIEVKDPNALTKKVAVFLQESGFVIGNRNGETVWTKSGFGCQHYIITEFKSNSVVITAFITSIELMLGRRHERESTIKGFVGGFGKWPLKKIVRALEKMLRESTVLAKPKIGIDRIPKVFKDKYLDDTNKELSEIIAQFNADFSLEKYVSPRGFLAFTKTGNQYSLKEDLLDIEPVKYEEILNYAYDLLYGSDVFNLPPDCIPFAVDESGHNTYALDYRECGMKGEPKVISVDNELDITYTDNEDIATYTFKNNIIADNFADFLKMCGFEITFDGEIEQLLLKLKNANLESVQISPAHESFSAEQCRTKYPFLPDDYIAFLSNCNGIYSHTFCLSGFGDNFGCAPSLEIMQQYLDGYGKGYKAEDWFFFGSDGMGGEYAFPTDASYETVYYFDHDSPEGLKELESFTEFLEEEIDMLIEISNPS